jgi:hypothetical protein
MQRKRLPCRTTANLKPAPAATLLRHGGCTAVAIFGHPDELKLRSSMTLSVAAAPDAYCGNGFDRRNRRDRGRGIAGRLKRVANAWAGLVTRPCHSWFVAR